MDNNFTKDDATYAYRGYRLQALYTLWRILSPNQDVFFQPEGYEDLTIFEGEAIVEVIQVKAYSNDLVLSDFKLSFFHRVEEYLLQDEQINIKLVVFGSVGNELKGAFSGNTNIRDKVITNG